MIPKSILIFCESNSKIGIGHLSRSIELYLELAKFKELEVFLFANCEETVLNNLLISRGVKESENIICSKKNYIQNLKRLVSSHKFNLLLWDASYGHESLRKYLLSRIENNIALDYFYDHSRPDISINLFNQKEYESKDHSIFSGGRFAIIRDEFKKIRKIRESLEYKDISNFLIFFGGSDPNNRTLDALRFIKKSSFGNEDTKARIIIGPSFHMKSIEKILLYLKENTINHEVFNSPKKVSSLFEGQHVVFCGGGTSLLESMSMGFPSVVFPQTNEESRHAQYYYNKGCCLLGNKLNCAELLTSLDIRKKIIKNSLQEIDFKGKNRIIDLSLSLINEQK